MRRSSVAGLFKICPWAIFSRPKAGRVKTISKTSSKRFQNESTKRPSEYWPSSSFQVLLFNKLCSSSLLSERLCGNNEGDKGGGKLTKARLLLLAPLLQALQKVEPDKTSAVLENEIGGYDRARGWKTSQEHPSITPCNKYKPLLTCGCQSRCLASSS